jgi:HK97 family phage prohead protease
MTMPETLTRSFDWDLEIRSDGDGRTVDGILVPYDVEQEIRSEGIVEVFRAGAFRNQLASPGKVRYTREHWTQGGQVIGRATELREDAKGLRGTLRVSKTQLGDETLELIRDGALDELSIGFRSGPRGSRRGTGNLVERVSAHLIEVASVVAGAYGRRAVTTGVRSAEEFSAPNLERAIQLRAMIPPLPDLSRLVG